MSLYNLENQSAFNYYKKHRQILLDMSDKEYIYNYFLVGEKINKKEQQFSLVMKEMLCTENCELINYINDKINGKLESKIQSGLEIIKQDNKNITYNVTQVIETPMQWEDTAW
jgi:hypothetical protein